MHNWMKKLHEILLKWAEKHELSENVHETRARCVRLGRYVDLKMSYLVSTVGKAYHIKRL